MATAAIMPAADSVPRVRPLRRVRNDAIDWVRGLAMIVMALDHTRDFVGPSVDLATAGPALFFTRWITHFCAPTFVLLAGTGAYLHGRRLPSTRSLSRYLATRGLWLIFLEVTVVRAGWLLYLGPDFLFLQVIWAIGASMIVLAGLVWLPRSVLLAFVIIVIGGHDLFDGVAAESAGSMRWLWVLLHQGGRLTPFEGAQWYVAYPLIPWPAVMAAGYWLGPVMTRPQGERRAWLGRAGAALVAGFIFLRASHLYGDPHAWTPEGGLLHECLQFLNCAKYPPSLLYLAMTLGPALVLLAAMDRPLGRWEKNVSIFGRVPLFYYVLHLFLIHAIAIALAWPSLGSEAVAHPFFVQGGLGYSLPVVYGIWTAVVAILYPPCRWFAGVKSRSDAAWLSFL